MKRGCSGLFSGLLLKLVPKRQFATMSKNSAWSDVIWKMNEKVYKMPDITEAEYMKRHPLVLHYFSGFLDWYICAWDKEDRFFGYVACGYPERDAWRYINRKELLAVEPVLARHGDSLNLDFYCRHETIEDALYARDNKYFARYKKEECDD